MQGFWTFWQKHQLYFHLMLWPILLGWIPALLFDKGDGVHFFLDFRGPKLNLFFRLFTQATEGFALLFCFGALLFIRLRYSLLFIFGTGLSLALSQGLKLFFQFCRSSPSNTLEVHEELHGVDRSSVVPHFIQNRIEALGIVIAQKKS